MQMKLLVLVYCCILSLSGCILASNPSLNWSENIALMASSSDQRINDDNMYTQGETSTIRENVKDLASQQESDNFTEALLSWNMTQTIQQVVIKAKEGQLEFFEIQYMNDEGEWTKIKEVRDNMRPVYKYTLGKPIMTKKFRLKVPRRWDSRHVGGQSRSRRSDTGAPAMIEFRKIQEIQLFYALPPPTENVPAMQ